MPTTVCLRRCRSLLRGSLRLSKLRQCGQTMPHQTDDGVRLCKVCLLEVLSAVFRLEQLEKKCHKYEEQLQECIELEKRVCKLESQLNEMQEHKRYGVESLITCMDEGEEEGDVGESLCTITTCLPENTEVNFTVKRKKMLHSCKERNQPGGIQSYKADTHLMKLEQRDQLRKKRKRMQYFSSCPKPSQLPNRACCREVILWLASKVSSWKFLGRWLGLEERDIQRIVTENPESVREQCYQMLVQWERLHPEMYSYCVLGEALVNDEENRNLYSQFVEEVEQQDN